MHFTAPYVTLDLLGKLLKRRKTERKDTSERSPRGFTFSSIWQRKKASPTNGSLNDRVIITCYYIICMCRTQAQLGVKGNIIGEQ